MKPMLPVGRDVAGWPGGRLSDRVRGRADQFRPVEILLGFCVPKPVFAGFESGQEGVARLARMSRGVLGRRRVAAADMAASTTPAQVEPPPRSLARHALHASVAARWHARVDA